MDDTNREATGSAARRSEEEMAWDAEFANMEEPKEGGVKGTLESLATMLVKLPAALVQLPMAILPEETQKHTRAAVLESFLALRSLLSAVGDGIEGAFSEAGDKKGTVRGPQGTWGSGRYSPSQGKAQRIEIQDEVSEAGGGDGSGTRITIDDLGDAGDENDETKEGRGLRADIDY